jgi:hypothetical protein
VRGFWWLLAWRNIWKAILILPNDCFTYNRNYYHVDRLGHQRNSCQIIHIYLLRLRTHDSLSSAGSFPAGCHQLVRPAGTGLHATCLWCYNQSDDGETNANHYNQQDERQQTMMISNETFNK